MLRIPITRKKTIIIVATLLIVIIVTLAIILSLEEKPSYKQISYDFGDFQDYPSNITLERPKITTTIDQTIASIKEEEDSKVAVKAHLGTYVDEYDMSMRVTALGSFNGSDGIFSDSIKYMKISCEAEDDNVTADFMSTEMELWNLEKHNFGKSPNEYVRWEWGRSYWWSEGVGYNNVCMETTVLWKFWKEKNQSHMLHVTAELAVGNLFSTRKIVTSVQIHLTAPLYTTRNPIYINGDTGFTPENGVRSGNGSQTDPYIIKRWDISALSANGIEIRNTNAYFIIKNCYVHDGDLSYDGIYFYNVTNGIIKNTISTNNYHGIYLAYSNHNNKISNNNALYNLYGISLHVSNDSSICENSVSQNDVVGIYLYASSNNSISNNSVLGNVESIFLQQSSSYNIFVFNNISSYGVHDCCVKIYDSSCENNAFHHNNFIDSWRNVVDDIGSGTGWDDGHGEGNYWADYRGLDDGSNGRVAGDGIGDTDIPHNGRDNYPLMEPTW